MASSIADHEQRQNSKEQQRGAESEAGLAQLNPTLISRTNLFVALTIGVREVDMRESFGAIILAIPRHAHVGDLAAVLKRGTQIIRMLQLLERLEQAISDEFKMSLSL